LNGGGGGDGGGGGVGVGRSDREGGVRGLQVGREVLGRVEVDAGEFGR